MSYFDGVLNTNESIAALATPPGTGGIAVIRISGEEAITLVERIFHKDLEKAASHTVHYGYILDENGDHLDDVLVTIFRTPHSYTGENTVEISCHGSSIIARKVLERLFSVGARAARPGEFTLRAFLNNKIDLAQAEAVQDLIGAQNEHAMHFARGQLEGAFSLHIRGMQKKITEVAAILEAWVDFPEEGLEFASMDEVVANLRSIIEELHRLVATFHDGKKVHEGVDVCIAGQPNVGKSSLMNALLGKERAIVTDLAGTTRDTLEETLSLGGLHLQLMDTAGIRDTEERIEEEGIRRAKKRMQDADIVILLLDASKGLEQEDKRLLEMLHGKKVLVVWNKVDRGPYQQETILEEYPTVAISAKERTGLEEFKEALLQLIWDKGLPDKSGLMVSSLRHKEALEDAERLLTSLVEGLTSGVSPEFVCSDIHHALRALGRIIGTDVTEDILGEIFSKFCVGK